MQDHRKLQVWQKAHQLTVDVINVAGRTRKSSVSDVRSQMARSAASIGANIAEGCGCHTQKDFARFLQVAFASSAELENHLQLARDTGVLGQSNYRDFDCRLGEVRRMLAALIRSVRARPDEPPMPDSMTTR